MINECFYEGSHDQWRKSKFQCINKIIVTNKCMYECMNLNIVLTNVKKFAIILWFKTVGKKSKKWKFVQIQVLVHMSKIYANVV